MFGTFRGRTRAAAATCLFTAVLLASGAAVAADDGTQGLRYPSLHPDGKTVVFAYRGDIWRAARDGTGHATRLTIHVAQDTLPRVSPDGASIAFSSRRNGRYDLFVIPAEGGIPRQVTFHSQDEMLCGWSPDGKKILYFSNRSPSLDGYDLWEVPVEGGTSRRITRDGARDGVYSPDGRQIVYARGFNTIYHDDYVGSANYDLFVVDTAGGTPRRLTETPGNERHPFFSADGKTVFYVAEKDGVANFWSIPAEGGAATQVTRYVGDDVLRPELALDGKTVVFERIGRLYAADLTAGDATPVGFPIRVRSDVRNSGVETRTLTNGAEQVHVSADGRWLAAAVRGDIWILPASGGEARRLTSGPSTDQWPRFSPDGQTIAYSSDAKGNSDILLYDLKTRATRPLTKDPRDDFFHNWSPDGKRLVFTSERSGNRDIWTIDVATGEATQLTRHTAGDDDPTYSPDGRFIAFDSGREGGQAVFVMEADGSNVRRVTTGSAFYQVPTFSPDGSMIAFEEFDEATGNSGGLFVVATAGGEHVRISSDGSTACWTTSGEWIYFSADRRGEKDIYRVRAPRSINVGEKVPFFGRVEVDLRTELADLFDEAWLRLKEGFYDERMHGVDWDAMHKKYRDMAIDSEIKDEFHNVIRQMLAELNASHLGISAPASLLAGGEGEVVATGYLGVEFEPGHDAEGGRRVAAVDAGGPADRAGLRTGDVVVAVGNQRIGPDTDLDRLLTGTVGQKTILRYRPLSADGLGGLRALEVTPASAGQMFQAAYQRWARQNATRTGQLSKGQVAYIHLSQMDGTNLNQFRQAIANLNANRNVKGLVIDVRYNGGGNIHVPLLEILSAKPYMQLRERGRRTTIRQPILSWDKPTTVLINERSFSDAEVFPWAFKSAGRGKLVGVATPGGVIGTNDITLSDGSRFRIPRVGYWGMDGTKLEGNGAKPDYVVELTPDDRIEGRDPQLAMAVEVVLAEIEGREPKDPRKAEPAPEPEPEAPQPETPEPPEAPEPERPEPEGPGPDPSDSAVEPKGPEPAADAPAAIGDPLYDAVAGEWIRFRAATPEGELITTLEVVEVTASEVVLQTTLVRGETTTVSDPRRRPRARELVDRGGRPVTSGERETIMLAGRDVDCRVVTRTRRGRTTKTWYSNAIPVTGIARREVNGSVVMEVIEWGRK